MTDRSLSAETPSISTVALHSAFRYVELFAGVGGFGEALRALNGKCVLACELESQARRAFALNNPTVTAFPRDVRAIAELPPHDLLTGGFPCQPFSRAGVQPGFAGKSGSLFLEIVRLLHQSRPPMFLLENVAGLLSLPGAGATSGSLPAPIATALADAGYHVRYTLIDSARVLPQARRRCYIVGFRDAAAAERFKWPTLPRLGRGVGDVITVADDGEGGAAALAAAAAAAATAFALSAAQWANRLERGHRARWYIDTARPAATLTRSYRSMPGRSSAMRANAARARRPAPSRSAPASGWNNLIPVELEPAEGGAAGAAAVVAGEKGDDQRGARFFTHRECARLMGFAERFRVLREEDARGPASALFGNAVCPPIVAAVAACMLAAREDPAEEPATKRRRRECVAEDDVETIGAWTCPGARAALRLALDAVPPRSRDALASKMRDASDARRRGTDDDAQEDAGSAPPLNVCFRFRDTGACAWGDTCRFAHVGSGSDAQEGGGGVERRRIDRDAVFTLSHVHIPTGHAPKFEAAAQWILPHCRLNERANGQIFQHLHASVNPRRKHAYEPARCGYCDRNLTGRGALISKETETNEFMWFEEWRDWSGVEKHGRTEYGKRFHSILDNFIEEEWSFYKAPFDDVPACFDPAVCHVLPPREYFDSPDARSSSHLDVVHLRVQGAAARHKLLAEFAALQHRAAVQHKILPRGGEREAGANTAARGTGMVRPVNFMIILENRDVANQFVVLIEGEPAALALSHSSPSDSSCCDMIGNAADALVAEVQPIVESAAHLRFGAALWPGDWDATTTIDAFPLDERGELL